MNSDSIKNIFNECIYLYYKSFPRARLPKDKTDSLRNWCVINFEKFHIKIPSLTPVQFIIAVLYFYNALLGKQSSTPSNSLEMTALITGGSEFENTLFGSCPITGDLMICKESHSLIVGDHTNVIKCLELLSSPENQNGILSIRGGKRKSKRNFGKSRKNKRSIKRRKRK
jgi:hypothetical protein